MATKTWMFVGLLASTAWVAAVSAAPPAAPAAPAVTSVAGKTADQVLAEYVAARGGEAKLQAIKTVRMTGKFSGGGLTGLPAILQKKRPNKLRRDLTRPDGKLVQAFDGQTAWQIGGPTGGPKAAPAPDAQARRLRRSSEFEGPVPDRAKTDLVELLGKEKVGEREAYLLKFKFKDGEEATYDFDTASHLLIRMTETVTTPSGALRLEVSFRDYKSSGGVLWPFTEVVAAEGGMNQTLVWDTIETNAKVDDSIFKMPSS